MVRVLVPFLVLAFISGCSFSASAERASVSAQTARSQQEATGRVANEAPLIGPGPVETKGEEIGEE
jgi:hypothetical protein